MKHIRDYMHFICEGRYWGSIAAGILPICVSTGRILVGLRSGDVLEPYTWGTFGGKLDIDEGVDETIKVAALRELEEETGFSDTIELIDAYVYRDGAFSYHNFFGLVENEFDSELNWENEDAQWLTLEELVNLEDKHFGLQSLINNSMEILKKISKQ